MNNPSLVRLAGIAYLLIVLILIKYLILSAGYLGVAAWLFLPLIFLPILPIILFGFWGYRLTRFVYVNRLFLLSLSLLTIFVSLIYLFILFRASFRGYLLSDLNIIVNIGTLVTLILLNFFVIYVAYFSRDKTFFIRGV